MLLFNQWLGCFSSPLFACFTRVFFSGFAGRASSPQWALPTQLLAPRCLAKRTLLSHSVIKNLLFFL